MRTWLLYGLFFVCAHTFIFNALHVVFAQDYTGTSVASSFVVVGDATDGDIVSHDPARNGYRRAVGTDGDSIFGIIVDDPVLYMSTVDVEGARPIVRNGEAVVNVSTVNGPIKVGDLVAVSSLEGLGELANREESPYVVGVALQGMLYATTTRDDIPTGVRFGRVPIALRIGQFVNDEDSTGGTTTSPAVVGPTKEAGFDYFMVARYIIAATVVVVSILIALKSFGGALSQSVISVGRNPLARSSIFSMMLWNSLFILIVSSVGLGIGIAIIIL